MKILSVDQIKQMDQDCINQKSISSFNLMEIAAKKCFEWIINSKFLDPYKVPFIILSGNGNNGGDGLSIARLMHLNGIKVHIYIINITNNYSNDFLLSKKKLIEENIKFHNIYENEDFPIFNNKNYLIDSIFGIGLNRSIKKYWKNFFEFINRTKFQSVISIDIPSGLLIKGKNDDCNAIIKSDYTLSFQVPKLPFFFPDYEDFIGKWYLLDIGWNKKKLKKIYVKNFFLEKKDIKIFRKHRKKFSHKGHYGNGLLIGGSYGMIGSLVLSAKASFRCGIGKLYIYTSNCGYSIVQNNILEAIVLTDKSKNWISKIIIPENIQAIGIGMGMGKNLETISAIKSFFLDFNKNKKNISIVIDADAINILSKEKDLKKIIPIGSILTPHPKEFKKMFGTWKNDYQKISILKNVSKKYKIFIILKGAYTIVSTPDEKLYFNSTGNPGMATAGSGDVLTGMIISFLCQGYSSKISCIMSVYLHGLSGDIAQKKLCQESMMASDIINNISSAFQKI